MDPGGVVWLPGSGQEYENQYDAICQQSFGGAYYGCGTQPWEGGTWLFCCPA